MIRTVTGMMAAVMLLTAPPVSAQPDPGDGSFAFVAIGDVPYYRGGRREEHYQSLYEMITAAEPDFLIHVGDIKSSGSTCSETRYATERDRMNGFDGPVIYTPGDNEWTDCHRGSAGNYDPVERLSVLRSMFFADDRSLGRQPIDLLRQTTVDSGAPTPENALWWHQEVLFATVHVVGSGNNSAIASEFEPRDAANTAWIEHVFGEATAARSPAVVLALHADIFEPGGRRGAFRATLSAIAAGARMFGGPVLVVHGDSHRFTINRPMMDIAGDLDNVLRLQVFGDAEVHAVRVIVDPDSPGVFAFQPIFVPGNMRASRGG